MIVNQEFAETPQLSMGAALKSETSRGLSGVEKKACILGLSMATGLLLLISSTVSKPLALEDRYQVGLIGHAVITVQDHRQEAITAYLASKYRQTPESVRNYVAYAWKEAARHNNVTPELILAVIQKESSMRPMQMSNYGAEGLMQVVRRWHPEKLSERESLMDDKVNIRVGAQILEEYIKREGVVSKALVKYSGNARGYSEFVIREAKVLESI